MTDSIAAGILKAINLREVVLVHPRYLPQVLTLQVQGVVSQRLGSLGLLEVRKQVSDYCRRCGALLTEADAEAGHCTQCKEPVR